MDSLWTLATHPSFMPFLPVLTLAQEATVHADYDTLLLALSQLHLTNYFQVAAVVVLVYDTILTFGDEIQYIWQTNWSLPKALYIFARYYGLVHLIFSMGVAVSPGFNLHLCQFYFWSYSLGGPVVFEVVINVILIMRIHALYGRSTKILVLLVVMLSGEFATGMYFSVLTSVKAAGSVIELPVGFTGCFSTFVRVENVIIPWTFCLLAATMFFLMTCFRFWKDLHAFKTCCRPIKMTDWWSFSPVLIAFYRDGTLFFFLIFAVTLVSTVATTTILNPLQTIALPWVITIYVICACRLILNLRAAAYSKNPDSTWAETLMVPRFSDES